MSDYDKFVEAWLQNKVIEDAYADCYNLPVDRATLAALQLTEAEA